MTAKEKQSRFSRLVNLFLLKDFSEAEKTAEKLKTYFKEDYRFHLLLGNIYTSLDKNRDAIHTFKHVIDLNPKSADAYNNLALIYRRLGEFEKASASLGKALSLEESKPEILYNLANLHKAMGNHVMAIETYRRVLALDPQFMRAYNNLGAVYENRNERKMARQVYEEGLEKSADNASLLYNLGVLNQQEERWEEAETCFRKALSLRPGWTDCQNNLAIVLQEKGELTQARQILHRILEKERNNPAIYNNMGVVQSRLGNMEDARQYYSSALELDRDYKRASLNLNRVFKSEKNYKDSLNELNRLVTVYPFDMEIRHELGESLIRLNQFKEGEQTFMHIVQRDPDNLEARKSLAELYIRQGEEGKAKNQLNHIGSALFEDDQAVHRIADAFRKNSNLEEAEELFRRHLDFNPRCRDSKEQLARTLDEEGKAEEALSLMEELEREAPLDPERLGEMVKLYRETDRKMEALSRLDDLVSLHGERGSSQDLDRMKELLDIYENTADDIYRENRREWESKVDRLVRRVKHNMPVKPVRPEQPPLINADSFPSRSLEEEDTLTLLDMGTMEPVITINELEEDIYLEDSKEDFSEIYSEVMKEEERRRRETSANQPNQQVGTERPGESYSPHPIIVPVPQNITVNPPAQEVAPPLEEEEEREFIVEEEPEELIRPDMDEKLPVGMEKKPPPPPVKDQEERIDLSEPEKGIEKNALIGMLDYIYGLTNALPDEKQIEMIRDEVPIKLECVKSKLLGERSLMVTASQFDRRQRSRQNMVIDGHKLKNSLDFLKSMSHEYPDSKVSESFDSKLEKILRKIGEAKNETPRS